MVLQMNSKKRKKGTRDLGNKKKSRFQEYLELEMGTDAHPLGRSIKDLEVERDKDLEIERKLAKKLNIKKKKNKSKLNGPDDAMNFLIGESLTDPDPVLGYDEEVKELLDEDFGEEDKYREMHDSMSHERASDSDYSSAEDLGTPPTKAGNVNKKSSREKKKKKQKQQCDFDVPAKLQEDELAEFDSMTEEGACISSENPAKKKHKRKKINASEKSHRASLDPEFEARRRVKGLFNLLDESNVELTTQKVAKIFQSLPRSVAHQIVSKEFLAIALSWEKLASVYAAFIAGMTCLVGLEFSAELTAHLARLFEDEYLEQNEDSLKILTYLLCNMYLFGVFSSDLMYDLLSVSTKRLTELDVSLIQIVLNDFGMKLRKDDPTAMKECIINIRDRIKEFKSSLGTEDGMRMIQSKRMNFMLETICDIKDNKKKDGEEPGYHTTLRKWLDKLGVGSILLRGVKWSKLLDPEKKDQWWVSGDASSNLDNVGDMTTIISKDVMEAQKLVQLAATAGMNTDVRRAIFCIIMSADDYVDAVEKILRLNLTGKQDREIMRVLVECCLQEKTFNKYYTVLASRLCSLDKNNKFSLQYCIWDHFKELESIELNRSFNLARFVAEMFTSFSLSLAILKVVDMANPANLTPKWIMHFRMLFDAIFENSDAVLWNIFSRVAASPELEMLIGNLLFFVKRYVVTGNPDKAIAAKFKIVKKALDNAAGVLM